MLILRKELIKNNVTGSESFTYTDILCSSWHYYFLGNISGRNIYKNDWYFLRLYHKLRKMSDLFLWKQHSADKLSIPSVRQNSCSQKVRNRSKLTPSTNQGHSCRAMPKLGANLQINFKHARNDVSFLLCRFPLLGLPSLLHLFKWSFDMTISDLVNLMTKLVSSWKYNFGEIISLNATTVRSHNLQVKVSPNSNKIFPYVLSTLTLPNEIKSWWIMGRC